MSNLSFAADLPHHFAAQADQGAAKAKTDLGILPEWNLDDLDPGLDSEAYQADLTLAAAQAKAFAADYQGKLAELAKGANAAETLCEAIKRYEDIDDRLGRIISYAGLVYSGETTDPVRA